MTPYMFKLPKHMRRSWGRAFRKGRHVRGLRGPTRRGFVLFSFACPKHERLAQFRRM